MDRVSSVISVTCPIIVLARDLRSEQYGNTHSGLQNQLFNVENSGSCVLLKFYSLHALCSEQSFRIIDKHVLYFVLRQPTFDEIQLVRRIDTRKWTLRMVVMFGVDMWPIASPQ